MKKLSEQAIYFVFFEACIKKASKIGIFRGLKQDRYICLRLKNMNVLAFDSYFWNLYKTIDIKKDIVKLKVLKYI